MVNLMGPREWKWIAFILSIARFIFTLKWPTSPEGSLPAADPTAECVEECFKDEDAPDDPEHSTSPKKHESTPPV